SLLADTKIDELENVIEGYLTDIHAGIDWLDNSSESKDESAESFGARRKIVQSLVDRVTLMRDASPEISLRLDLSSTLEVQSPVA
ncbi:MAG: hypothetical protein ACE5JF_01005, partial [Anaerolineales bacterium]